MKRYIKSEYIPERPLDPPESDYTDLDNVSTEIDIPVDFDAEVVNEFGTYVDKDTKATWAGNPDDESGDWYDSEYGVFLGDSASIAETIDDLMSDTTIYPKGTKLHFEGTAKLVYTISGVYETQSNGFTDDQGDYVYDSEVYTEDAEVTLDKDKCDVQVNVTVIE